MTHEVRRDGNNGVIFLDVVRRSPDLCVMNAICWGTGGVTLLPSMRSRMVPACNVGPETSASVNAASNMPDTLREIYRKHFRRGRFCLYVPIVQQEV